jgi:glycosyltransferase involved in cell wall biosynthesis
MNIFILSSFEDSMQKDTGGSVRIYNLAKGLASNGNNVKVILPKYQATLEVVEGVAVHGFKGLTPKAMLEVLRKILNVTRPTALYFYDFLFAFRISHLISEADIVQIEHQASGLLLIPFIRKVLKKPVVVDCHDVFQALRVKHTSTLRRIIETFLEKLAYRSADLLLTVSETEKEFLISNGFNEAKIQVVPNGVDTKLFERSSGQSDIRKKYGLEGYRIVVFVGNLAYIPNREAIQALSSIIVPKVLEEIKDVKFLVVGKMEDKMQLLGLVFTGFVDNVAEILSMSDVAVAPLFHGSGTRLKILEYLSCGLSVVSTSVGAEGLDVRNGYNIFVDDDLESFALHIVELLKNKELSIKMGNAGRALAMKYDWKHITNRLETGLHNFFLTCE